MAKIKIFHKAERAYVSDAIKVYIENNASISSDWKSWLEGVLEGIQSEEKSNTVEDKNNYLQEFYNTVLSDYLKDEFRRARNSPAVLNGFCYGNIGRFLHGWSIQN